MYMCACVCVCVHSFSRAWIFFHRALVHELVFFPPTLLRKGLCETTDAFPFSPFLSFLLSINHLHFQLINTQIRLITVFWNRLPPQNYDVSFLSTFSYFNSFVYSYASPFQFLQIMVHMRWTVTFTLIKTNP